MDKEDQEILAFSPKFKELTEVVLYGDIWNRKQLAKKERSIITLSALISLGRFDQLSHHINLAKNNGLSEEMLLEIFTHLAFYAGWPSTVSAIKCLRNIKNSEI